LSHTGIKQLTLTHFRSYAYARLQCDSRPVIITGPNGAGKTNILEAISYLNPGRGLRSAKLQDCLYQAPNQLPQQILPTIWGVAAQIDHQGSPLDVGTSYSLTAGEQEGRRLMRLQQRPCQQQEILNYIRLIWLTPQMDRLFIDGGTARRKFLDRLVYLTDPLHATRVQKYEHVTRERLKILKSSWHQDTLWLDSLEQQMAELSVAIVDARLQTLAKLMQAENWALGLFPKANLSLSGEIETLMQQHSFVIAEEHLQMLFRQQRLQDQQSGRTTTGAHRSHFTVIFIDKNQPAELCSTGEQKALLLSIVMAACRLQALRHEGAPIVLLDEVVAHLDTQRRAHLFAEILNLKLQVWITGTDPDIFYDFGDQAQYFKIAESTIARYN